MKSCPNIDGNQVRYRKASGYISLALTLIFIYFISINDIGFWMVLVFLPAIVMTISLLEALDLSYADLEKVYFPLTF